MRNFTFEQKYLFDRYTGVGNELAAYALSAQEPRLVEYYWEHISKKRMWQLPVSKCYGGIGLNWKSCVAAFGGLFSTFPNVKLITLAVSQFSAEYLISKYGSEQQKAIHLPKLAAGKKIEDQILISIQEKDFKIHLDYIKFKRNLYGVIVAGYAHKIANDWYENLQNKNHFVPDHDSLLKLTKKFEEAQEILIQHGFS